jgi:hypothetical protein
MHSSKNATKAQGLFFENYQTPQRGATNSLPFSVVMAVTAKEVK